MLIQFNMTLNENDLWIIMGSLGRWFAQTVRVWPNRHITFVVVKKSLISSLFCSIYDICGCGGKESLKLLKEPPYDIWTFPGCNRILNLAVTSRVRYRGQSDCTNFVCSQLFDYKNESCAAASTTSSMSAAWPRSRDVRCYVLGLNKMLYDNTLLGGFEQAAN